MTDAQREAVVLFEAMVSEQAREGAGYADGKYSYSKEGRKNAQMLREIIHRGLSVQAAGDALVNKAKGLDYRFNPEEPRDAWLANFKHPQLNELVDAIGSFGLIDGPTVVGGRTVVQRAYDITRTFENIFTSEVDMSSLQRSIKRTVASGHFPLPRSGTFHVVTRAYLAGTDTVYNLYDDYRTNAPYYIEDNAVHAQDRAKELGDIFKGQIYTIKEPGKPDIELELRAEYAKSPQVSGLSGHVSLTEFASTLERLGINLNLGERDRLNDALSGLDSSVRRNMKREQTPGYDKDIFGKGVLPQMNAASHVIGMITHGHNLDEVLLDNQLWEGTHQGVLAAHARLKAVEAGGNVSQIKIAQREYDQIAWQRYNSGNVNSPKTLMYKGYGANRKSIERATLGKAEDYRDAGKQVVGFLKQNGGNIDGIEDYFTRGFAGKMKMLVVVGQLGMNPALALHNMSAVITHAGPYLASYSAKRGFGGGFGTVRA
ncbi:MAG: hypothetical protein K8953_00855, partial [Proteobacteria bacterium]|nr:hypothetical protein [Pseudomonadota bacterium]